MSNSGKRSSKKKINISKTTGKRRPSVGGDASKVSDPETVYATFKRPGSTTLYSYINRSMDIMGMTGLQPFIDVINENDFIFVIRSGVPKKALDNLMRVTGITVGEVSGILGISDRTLRRYSSKQKLNPGQSERIIELAKLYSRGEEVFGSLGNFKEWMNRTVMALGNKKPKEFLDTSLGIDMLMNELGRIEHGIFA